MPAQHLFSQHLKAYSLKTTGRIGETPVNNLVAQAHRLENLGPLIRLQSRDSHLTHDLKHALGNTLAVSGQYSNIIG